MNLMYLVRFTLAVCSFALVGCTVPTKVVFFNASSSELTIEYRNEQRDFQKAMLNPGEKVQVEKLLEREFRIYQNNALLSYSFETIPGRFIQHVGFGPFFKRIAKAQFNEDKCIYLVPVEKDFPAESENDDVGSFSLCPTEVISDIK